MIIKKTLLLLILTLFLPLNALAAPQAGDVAPDFNLNNLEGKPIQLHKLLSNPAPDKTKSEVPVKYKGVVLNFFSLTCRPCRYELPELDKLHQQYKDKGILFIALSLDDSVSAEVIKKYMTQLKVTFPVALKAGDAVSLDYGVRSIPATYVVGPDKKIAAKFVGYSGATLRALEEKIKLLAK